MVVPQQQQKPNNNHLVDSAHHSVEINVRIHHTAPWRCLQSDGLVSERGFSAPRWAQEAASSTQLPR